MEAWQQLHYLLIYQSLDDQLDDQKRCLTKQSGIISSKKVEMSALQQRLALITREKKEIEHQEAGPPSAESNKRMRKYQVLEEKEKQIKEKSDRLVPELWQYKNEKEQEESNLSSLNSEQKGLRREIEEKVGKAVIDLYNKLKKHNYNYPVVPVKRGYCTGCNLALPIGTM